MRDEKLSEISVEHSAFHLFPENNFPNFLSRISLSMNHSRFVDDAAKWLKIKS